MGFGVMSKTDMGRVWAQHISTARANRIDERRPYGENLGETVSAGEYLCSLEVGSRGLLSGVGMRLVGPLVSGAWIVRPRCSVGERMVSSA